MILHVPPGSPLLVRAAAEAILAAHIGGGVVGVLSGGVAMAARKGGRLHRTAGQVFFVSMLVMAGIGTVVSPFLPSWSNVVMGLFVLYLVVTARMTVRRPAGAAGPPEIGAPEIGAFVFACCAAVTGIVLGLVAAASPKGLLAGDPPVGFFVLACLPGFAATQDLRMIFRGGLSRDQRLARHLWRMSVALFVGAGSLFLGQGKLFPHWLRGSPIMFAPEIAILVLMIFWLLRVRTRKGSRAEPVAAQAPRPAGLARSRSTVVRLQASD
jgi:uncharacterized membrane protein